MNLSRQPVRRLFWQSEPGSAWGPDDHAELRQGICTTYLTTVSLSSPPHRLPFLLFLSFLLSISLYIAPAMSSGTPFGYRTACQGGGYVGCAVNCALYWRNAGPSGLDRVHVRKPPPLTLLHC